MPAVARLKASWPEAKIAWLVNSEWAPLLAGNPDVAEAVLFPRQEFRGVSGLRKVYPWARAQVRQRRPDLALDFQGLLRSALIGRLSRPQLFLGLEDAREGARWLYGRAVPVPLRHPHAVERYLALAGAALGRAPASSSEALRFPLPAGDPIQSAAGAGLPADFILLHPFARGAAKSLTTSQVRAFCERLRPRQVVLAGRHGGDGFQAPPGVIDLLNRTTLSQLIWLLRRAAFVISVDSGPMHLAAALGRPLVSIHTWTDPRRVGPYRADAWVWKNGRLQRFAEITAAAGESGREPMEAPVPLAAPHIEAICALATSPSYSCA